MAEYLVDLNVFTAVLKGDARLRGLIESLDSAIETVVYLELLQASSDPSQTEKIERYLTNFELIYFDKNISMRAFDLTRTYSKNFGLKLPDSIIAAACLEFDLTLITQNVKDFRFIDGLKIYQF